MISQPSPGQGAPALHDVIVVGGGPAGLAAALVLGRSRRTVLVVDDGQPRNAPSRGLHGFPTRDGIAPLELLRLGREEVRAYGVVVRDGRVVSVNREEDGVVGFQVAVETGEVFRCRRLLLATGVTDALPRVDGMLRYYGRGVHHCPFCDGWEVRDRRLMAFGVPPGSPRLGLHLRSWSADVVVCTDGEPVGPGTARKLERNGVRLLEERLLRLEGGDGEDGRLQAAVLERSGPLGVDAVFLSVDRVQHSDLPARLGCEVDEGGRVHVRGAQRTRVPGLFVAGDAAGDVQFAVVAAAEGARAAVAIQEDLEREDLL